MVTEGLSMKSILEMLANHGGGINPANSAWYSLAPSFHGLLYSEVLTTW